MKKPPESPVSIRVNEEDREILAYLQERLGLKLPQVVRLALRRLYEQEKRSASK